MHPFSLPALHFRAIGELVSISSSYCAKGRGRPRQAASPSQGHRETTVHILAHADGQRLPVHYQLT